MKNYPHLSQAVGQTLDTLRRERKFTKTALSIRSDLEERYVRAILKGTKNPTVFVLQSLCEALGITLGEFFTLVDKTSLNFVRQSEKIR